MRRSPKARQGRNLRMLRERRARPGPQASSSLVPRQLLQPRALLLAPVLSPRPLGTNPARPCSPLLPSPRAPGPWSGPSRRPPSRNSRCRLRSLQPVDPAAAPRAPLLLCPACATRTPPPCPARLPHPSAPETRDRNRCRPPAPGLAGRGGMPRDIQSRGSQIKELLGVWLRRGLCPRNLEFWVGSQGTSVRGSFSSVCPGPCLCLLGAFRLSALDLRVCLAR